MSEATCQRVMSRTVDGRDEEIMSLDYGQSILERLSILERVTPKVTLSSAGVNMSHKLPRGIHKAFRLTKGTDLE